GCKARKIVRPAGFRPRAREAGSAERLRADDGADHAAVDVDVADGEASEDPLDRRVDPRMDSERESIAELRDIAEQGVEIPCRKREEIEEGAELFLSE